MLTFDDIQERVSPVAKAHGLLAVYLFGSFARMQANDQSDVDLLIYRESDPHESLLSPHGVIQIKQDFEESLDRPVDIVTDAGHRQSLGVSRRFDEALDREKVLIYEAE